MRKTTNKEIRGKCTACRIVWIWPRWAMLLRDAYCASCGLKLVQTAFFHGRPPAGYRVEETTSPDTEHIARARSGA